MPVDDPTVIDVVGIDQTDEIVLSVSDHLDWSDEVGHLQALEEKLNAYLAFAESGELIQKYPNATGRQVRIDVILKYPPSSAAEAFFQHARAIVEDAGFGLAFRVLE